jgi:hypothetical protein
MNRAALLIVCIALVFGSIGVVGALVLFDSGPETGSSATRGTSSATPNPPPKFMLQRTDLTADDFVFAEQKARTRDEILATLPADSQVAESGLSEALEVRYVSGGELPMTIDVLVYGYADEQSARGAHMSLRNADWPTLRPVVLEDGLQGYAFQTAEASLLDGLGNEAFTMEGYVDRVEDYGGVDESNSVKIYFMQSGTRRAEVLVVGSHIFVDPYRVARNQFLRLERPDELLGP